MKMIISFTALLLTILNTQASGGCQREPGYEIDNLKVLSTQDIEEFKILARAPGVLQITVENKNVTLINMKAKSFIDTKKNLALVKEHIEFDEFDGCDRYLTMRTYRYIAKFKDRHNTREYQYEWPLIREYSSYYPIYYYSRKALVKN